MFRAVVGLVVVGLTAPMASAQSSKIAPQTVMINEALAATWKANNIKVPSPQANAHEFVRRAYLDLLGRIPRPDEVKAFVAGGMSAENRARLIHSLLHDQKKGHSAEFARHMANLWTVWLMTRTGNAIYREQMRYWLEEQFTANTPHKDLAVQLITARGKTNDNGAVNFVLSHLGENVARDEKSEKGNFEMVPVTSRTSRLFLGLQTQCVQCHDHPFNPEWKQQQFWGINVFFRQVSRVGSPIMRQFPGMEQAAVLELRDDDAVNKDGVVYYERRNGMILPTSLTFIDGRRAELDGQKSRREMLSDMIISHENFAKSGVNRYWTLLMGRSMTEQPTVDDFGEHNKVVHPELLANLAKEFSYKYDVKDLIYWIACSDAYALSSVATPSNDKPETDVFFSRMMLKAMTPEQLIDSLWVATTGKKPTDELGKDRDKRRAEWTQKLVRNFGDDEGNEVTFNGTVVQALLMMNGKEINEEIGSKSGMLVDSIRRHKGNYSAVISDIYMACLGRPPKDHEMAGVNKVANRYGGKYDMTFFTDVMWALLNSNEFILNH